MGPREGKAYRSCGQGEVTAPTVPPLWHSSPDKAESAPPQSKQGLFSGQHRAQTCMRPHIWLWLGSFQASSRWHCHQGRGSQLVLGEAQLPWLRPSWAQSTQDRVWAGSFLQALLLCWALQVQ